MINKGMTVRLKSGGPVMTAGFLQNSGLLCYWFLGPQLMQGHFAEEALELADAPMGPEFYHTSENEAVLAAAHALVNANPMDREGLIPRLSKALNALD